MTDAVRLPEWLERTEAPAGEGPEVQYLRYVVCAKAMDAWWALAWRDSLGREEWVTPEALAPKCGELPRAVTMAVLRGENRLSLLDLNAMDALDIHEWIKKRSGELEKAHEEEGLRRRPDPDLIAKAAEHGRKQTDLTNIANAEGRLLCSLRYLETGRHPVFGNMNERGQSMFVEYTQSSVVFDAAGFAALLEKYNPDHAEEIALAFDSLYISVLHGTRTPEAEPLLSLQYSWWTDPAQWSPAGTES